ncbi:GNAT family N-acetyltransferase [Lysobacter claricitrinus]|uniref:GNAT family N-acetyltransferase n=1 Tax=Lysobacter claricitrinus TaxID=3367728 RepID=UPI0037DBC27B
MHDLDRPVWASLTTFHAPIAVGGALARRYPDDVNLFASTRDDDDAAAQAALRDLLAPGQTAYVLQVPEIRVPPDCVEVRPGRGVQMVATRALDDDAGDDVHALGDVDAAEMLALARLTKPGPFLARTHTMGAFIGVRIDGRLAAMAGERMRFPGHTEISGVCTHPDFRGRGLARRLSAIVGARIQARGDRPFLHAWAATARRSRSTKRWASRCARPCMHR